MTTHAAEPVSPPLSAGAECGVSYLPALVTDLAIPGVTRLQRCSRQQSHAPGALAAAHTSERSPAPRGLGRGRRSTRPVGVLGGSEPGEGSNPASGSLPNLGPGRAHENGAGPGEGWGAPGGCDRERAQRQCHWEAGVGGGRCTHR